MATSKGIFGLLLLVHITIAAKTQKPPLDLPALDNWPMVSRFSGITNDGKFVYYGVQENRRDSLIVKSVSGKWRRSVVGVRWADFTQNSQHLIFQIKDTVYLLHLNTDSVEKIGDLEGTYNLLSSGTDDNLLLFRLKKSPSTLYVNDVIPGTTKEYPSVENYWVNPISNDLYILSCENNSPHLQYTLQIINRESATLKELWRGSRIDNLVFNSTGTQFAFITETNNGRRSLLYYNLRNHDFLTLLDDTTTAINTGLKIESIFGISKESNIVYITLTDTTVNRKIAPPGVDVYSYKDSKLQSQQLLELPRSHVSFKAAINTLSRKVLRIENDGEAARFLNEGPLPDQYLLIIHRGTGDSRDEWYWRKDAQTSAYLLSLVDGSRKLLFKDKPYFWDGTDITMSPDEKHILYFDRKQRNYFSLNTQTGNLKNITNTVSTTWARQDQDAFPVVKYAPFGIAGFTKDGASAFLCSQYDIYKVDLEGKRQIINLTSAARNNRKIRFRLPFSLNFSLFDPNEPLILTAFDENNKNQGFYKFIPNISNRADSLSMFPLEMSYKITKARDTNLYLTQLASSTSSPNYFLTSNLRYYNALSNIHPEHRYNWLTSELVTWQLPDGQKYQGILYKPENINTNKKYPIIFIYYEQRSKDLNNFLIPKPSEGEINVPLFVSNGYLVFIPDIHYTPGLPGRSAFKAINSAADILSKRHYVDVTKMGLNGMSFGGLETNYIITHTTRFAAALSTSGMTDLISAYGSIIGDGTSRARQYEVEHDRIGATPWDRPDLYIENSPVLRANHVHTPILMVANDKDGDVPHEQGIELFTALRRLRKKAWMLQYDGQGHSVVGDASKDFTIRGLQFFNYYLKGAPAPKWMTTGIPARLKGIDDGLQVDTSGATP